MVNGSHILPTGKSSNPPHPPSNHVLPITRYILFTLLLSFNLQPTFAAEISGHIGVEGRFFPQAPLFDIQHGRANVSLVVEPEFYHEFSDDMSLTLTPYFRLDQHDSERTHVDLREFFWQTVGDSWELRVGINTVFWGVTESQHLVDIINQTDFVENPDGEDKLGQPMINFTSIHDWGTLDFFILPFFRGRNFPGPEGRLRVPLPVETDKVTYKSDAEEYHIDFALRWSHTIGDFDFGLSHFYGTNREPLLLPTQGALIPHYDLIHQTGLDVQLTKGGWLLKLEAIRRDGETERVKGVSLNNERFFALTGGFEYTFANFFDSGTDIGIVAEYLFDERGDEATTPFEDDLFVGARLALNDIQSTSVLAGTIIDRETGGNNLGIEASRRIGESWTLEIEARAFINTADTDFLYGLRRDDYVQAVLERHF